MSAADEKPLPDDLILLTCREVARILRVGRSTVYSLTNDGRLRSIRASCGSSRGSRRWRLLDVKAYLAGDPPPAAPRRRAARR